MCVAVAGNSLENPWQVKILAVWTGGDISPFQPSQAETQALPLWWTSAKSIPALTIWGVAAL